MTSLNVSLPPKLAEFVDGQTVRGRYRNSSQYIHALIRSEQKRQAKAALEAELLKGLDSKSTPMDDTAWKRLRQQLERRLNRGGR